MDDPTLPPRTPNTPRSAINWLLAWGTAHTVASAAILGFLAGWLLPKVARLLWG